MIRNKVIGSASAAAACCRSLPLLAAAIERGFLVLFLDALLLHLFAHPAF